MYVTVADVGKQFTLNMEDVNSGMSAMIATNVDFQMMVVRDVSEMQRRKD